MALGKPSPVSIILAIVMIGVIGYLAWSATRKSDDTSYTKGATHNESTVNISPNAYYYPLSIPGCSPFVRLDGVDGKGTALSVPEAKPTVKGKK